MQLASVDATYLGLTGQLEEALAQRRGAAASDVARWCHSTSWPLALDVVRAPTATPTSVSSTRARQLTDGLASSPLSPPPVTDVLCPGITARSHSAREHSPRRMPWPRLRWTRPPARL